MPVESEEGASAPSQRAAEKKVVIETASQDPTGVSISVVETREGSFGTPDNIYFSHTLYTVQVKVRTQFFASGLPSLIFTELFSFVVCASFQSQLRSTAIQAPLNSRCPRGTTTLRLFIASCLSFTQILNSPLCPRRISLVRTFSRVINGTTTLTCPPSHFFQVLLPRRWSRKGLRSSTNSSVSFLTTQFCRCLPTF